MTRVQLKDGTHVDVDVPDYTAIAKIIEARRARDPYLALGDDLIRVCDVDSVLPDFRLGRKEAA